MRKKKVPKLVETRARKRLSKELGAKELKGIEQLILKNLEDETQEVVILETPARARLRRKLGDEELSKLESRISSFHDSEGRE